MRIPSSNSKFCLANIEALNMIIESKKIKFWIEILGAHRSTLHISYICPRGPIIFHQIFFDSCVLIPIIEGKDTFSYVWCAHPHPDIALIKSITYDHDSSSRQIHQMILESYMTIYSDTWKSLFILKIYASFISWINDSFTDLIVDPPSIRLIWPWNLE